MSARRRALLPALSPPLRTLALALALVGAPAAATAAPWTAAGEGGAVIDWSAGAIRAKGTGPADRHAPSPTVARVAARRGAEAQARTRLAAAARALPWAAGGTVGAALDAAPAAAARFAAEVARAPVVAFDLGTDGSARVTLALGVEAVRQAVAGPRPISAPGTADDAGAVVWLVRGGKRPLAPAVGLAVAVGGARWDGPVRWIRDRADAGAPVGAAIVEVTAGAATGGVLAVSGATATPPAGAVVVVVVPEKQRP